MKNKYTETSLYNSANKIAGKYIKSIQSKIKQYLKSAGEIGKFFSLNFKSLEKVGYYYDGYSIGNDYIAIFVCCFICHDSFYKIDNCYSALDKCVNDITSIIKSEKLPFKIFIDNYIEEDSPIEIQIKISDLERLDPSLNKSLKDLLFRTISKKVDLISNDLGRISDKNNWYGILKIIVQYQHFKENKRNGVDCIDIGLFRCEYEKSIPSNVNAAKQSIYGIIKKYLPFNFTIEIDEDLICASVKISDIDMNDPKVKRYMESCGIFSSVAFI